MGRPTSPTQHAPGLPVRGSRTGPWRRAVRFAALSLAAAFSASAYDRDMRRLAARQIYLSAWPALPGFLLACTTLAYVLVRIVVGTARDFGLSGYALELTVRVLVIELLPLLAALAVGLRSGAAMSAHVALKHVRGDFARLHAEGRDPLRHELVPRAFGSVVAVMLLSWLSSAIAMLVVYEVVYGLSPWGVAQFLRATGQVFAPVVAAGLALKTLLFGLAVAAIPIASALAIPPDEKMVPAAVRGGMVRLGIALAAIELGALAVMYA